MPTLDLVWLIDDNEADNYYHQVIIKRSGIARRIRVFQYAEEALEALAAGDEVSDMVFLDINMPRMNGFEFLEAYEKLNFHGKRSVVVVMLTTSVNPSDEDKASGYPDVREFCSKPLTVEALHQVVKRYFPDRG